MKRALDHLLDLVAGDGVKAGGDAYSFGGNGRIHIEFAGPEEKLEDLINRLSHGLGGDDGGEEG